MGAPVIYISFVYQPERKIDSHSHPACGVAPRTYTAQTKWKTVKFNTKQLINKAHNAIGTTPLGAIIVYFSLEGHSGISFCSRTQCASFYHTPCLFFLQPCSRLGKHTLLVSFINTSRPRSFFFGAATHREIRLWYRALYVYLNKSFENTNIQRP